ncbi:glycosyltransferase family 4 protein [Ancylobacter sonchi]|uniref:glycosyltransferase family 4 protein n=1 Tax=Ancylobacter sonchi TaxID=1937790 RepID=UPI001BD635D7|nr:glycosyltransferase family 4 protein [Ancylobacter sonchi]MBS7534436.1 glycosyltransferase family 4 protein [Ancylobacter sonchi]
MSESMLGLSPGASPGLSIALMVHAFLPDQNYGTEIYTLELSRALKQLGHRPTVIAARRHGPAEIVREDWDGVPVIRVPALATDTRSTFDDPSRVPLYRSLFEELQPDVVHVCHFLYHTTAAHEAARQLDIPLVATFTDFHGFCHTGLLSTPSGTPCAGPSALRFGCLACGVNEKQRTAPADSWWKLLGRWPMPQLSALTALLYRPVLPRALREEIDAVRIRPTVLKEALNTYRAAIVPTEFTAQRYRDNAITVPMTVSRFGVDIDRTPKPPPPPGPLRIGYIGQIAPHKGLHVLIEAVRGLTPAAGQPAPEVDVWGSLDQHPAYATRIAAMAEGMQVRFAGLFDPADMASIMAGIDVLVIPSIWHENSPLTLLQALATHTPVLVSDVPGMRDFIEPGANGFAFPAGDTEGLAAALRPFIDDPGLAARLSRDIDYPRTSLDMARDVLAIYRSCGILPAKLTVLKGG